MSDRLLLDTCTIIWTGEGIRSRLSTVAKHELENPEREISVSAISVAEIAMLAQKRRVSLSSHWKQWFRTAVLENKWIVLSASWEVFEEAYSLPGDFHADPADRILVATARIHRMAIVTPDDHIRRYPHVDTVW